MRYQLKRPSVDANASPNTITGNANVAASAAPQNYIDDFLFGIGKDDSSNNNVCIFNSNIVTNKYHF
jgi:hypothetical protein